MEEDFPILRGPYPRDLFSQPRAPADTIAALRQMPPLPPAAARCRRVVLTGMGSSFHALHPLQIRLNRSGRTALMIETSELVHAQQALLDGGPTQGSSPDGRSRDGGTLVVAVSQSGRSAETLALLDRVAGREIRPLVVGVTNTADSPLAARADAVVLLKAGVEFSVSCKTYLATLVALEWLGGTLCGDDPAAVVDELDPAAAAVEGYLAAAATCSLPVGPRRWPPSAPGRRS
jgi:glucosamine--fructose-6-phosphate aminotransferase (isomerizing)